jgi:hypothetical protein
MVRPASVSLLFFLLTVSLAAMGQEAPDDPVANPGRPTVSTPATLTPAGYLQFETGYLYANHSPAFSSQSSFNEVMKFSVSRRLQFLASAEPFAHSRMDGPIRNDAGGVALGAQVVAYRGEGARPTVALSYFRSVYGGDAPDLDLGSARDSLTLLFSADVKGFHYDTNYLFNQVVEDGVHRAQFAQTLSVSHSLSGKFGLSGEIWHFSQPFLHGHAVGNLWALNYNANKHLVLDCGFNRGLTETSTRWEVFFGFTYLLPRNLLP